MRILKIISVIMFAMSLSIPSFAQSQSSSAELPVVAQVAQVLQVLPRRFWSCCRSSRCDSNNDRRCSRRRGSSCCGVANFKFVHYIIVV